MGTKVWRLVITPPLDGWLNMAIDELLFEEAKNGSRPPTLRFYEWAGDWVSFGYFQIPQKALNIEAAEELGVKAVRRLTGGRAVLHSEDLTYALVAGDAQRCGLGSSLKETYRQIARALTSGFSRLGLPVESSFKDKVSLPFRAAGPLACFLTLSDYEVSVEGKKLVGSAQRREGGSFLQHGSIPLTVRNRELAEQVLARKIASTTPKKDVASKFSSRYATIEETAERKIPVEELTGALRVGFAEVFGTRLEEEELSVEQMGKAGKLTEKYASQEWNERKFSTAEAKRSEVALVRGCL